MDTRLKTVQINVVQVSREGQPIVRPRHGRNRRCKAGGGDLFRPVAALERTAP